MAETASPTGTLRAPVFTGGPGIPGPRYVNFAGRARSTVLNWFPTLVAGTYTGQSQAAWSVTGNATYVAYGGEFPTVNGTGQQGLVRFAIRSAAPNRIGPDSSAQLTPSVVSQIPGTARVAWRATSDRDNESLTYRLFRDGGSTPIHTVTVASSFWYRPAMGFLDTGLAAGSTHTYRLTVTDPLGNAITGGTSAPVAIGSGSPTAYQNLVRTDGASNFWPLGEASGSTARDLAGFNDLTVGSGVTRGVAGPAAAGSTTASRFDGTAAARTSSISNGEPRTSFSVEAWVRTSSTAGGEVVGYGTYPSANSVDTDRTLYLGPDGRAFFGVWGNNARTTISSTGPVNDGAWHHLVGTVSAADGMRLFIDGARVASGASPGSTSVISGHWRVGGDILNGWPTVPTALPVFGPRGTPPTPADPFALDGSIADVAVYPAALAADRVAAHAGTATPPPANQPPTASFTSSCTDLTCSVDGSGSRDADGTIASYSWDFGDGGTASGATASHTYAAGGTYPVRLTVRDEGAATGSSTASVTATAPPAPTAFAVDGFDRSVTGGWGSADTGGAWTVTGDAANFAVTPGTGSATLPTAGGGPGTISLDGVSARDVDITTSVALDRVANGGGTYIYLQARRDSASSLYLAKVRVLSNGTVSVALVKRDGSTAETTITGSTTVAGLNVSAGTPIRIRFQATGAAPTALRAKVWAAAATEPSGLAVTGTDSSAALQDPGAVGVNGYLSGSATNAPVTMRFSSYSAEPPA